MEFISPEEFAAYNELVGSLYGNYNIEELRQIVTGSLHKLVPFDSLAFFLVNPNTNEFLSNYHFNLPGRMFDEYKNKYEKFDLYKEKVFSQPEIPPVDRASDYFDFKEWECNIHRRDFLIPYGCYYIACIQILAGKTFLGEISMHRNSDKTDFSDQDMFFLKAVQPHICNAFVNGLRFSFSRSPADLLLYALECKDKGIVIMDENMKVIYENEMFLSLSSKDKSSGGLIAELREIGLEMLDGSAEKAEFGSTRTGKYTSKGLTLAYSITTLQDNAPRSGKYMFLAKIEPLCNISGIQKLRLLLSKKEFIIAGYISRGMTLKEIAGELIISIDTVKTHVKKIYLKTKCKSRTELINNYFNLTDGGVL